MWLQLTIFIFFSSISMGVRAEAAAASQSQDGSKNDRIGQYFLCKNKKVVRTIRVEHRPQECVTFYTKDGLDKEVGRAQNSMSCARIASNIKENLVKAHWTCKELESVNITSSRE